MSDIIKRIENSAGTLTKAHQRIARYYLAHLSQVPFYTLEETAARMEVSTTTVIRFARALGYDGFTAMQKDIQQSLLTKVSLPERLKKLQESPDNVSELLMHSMQNDIENITATFSALDPEILQQVAERIHSSETVYILGLRSSFSLAHYLASRLGQIRPHVHLVQSEGMLYPEELSGCGEKDLCIAFFFPRYSRTTSNLLLWLKKRGTPVILFTSPNYEAIREYGDLIIPCRLTGISFKNSFAAPLALINAIASAVAITGHEQAMETIRLTEEFLDQGYYLGL